MELVPVLFPNSNLVYFVSVIQPSKHLMASRVTIGFLSLALWANNVAVAQSGFSQECTDIQYQNEWLIADCLTGEDSTARIQSSSFLNSKIANMDGILTVRSPKPRQS